MVMTTPKTAATIPRPGRESATLLSAATAREPVMSSVNGEQAIAYPDPGNTSLLELDFVADSSRFKVGDLVVTAGAQVTQHASLYPADVPVGRVQSVPAPGDTTSHVTVKPVLDTGTLDAVQVLTRVPR